MTTIKEHGGKTLEQVTTCCHHWRIESPNGPTSRGVCRRCGAVREFHNSVPGFVGAWARSSQAAHQKANDKAYKPREGEPDEGDEGDEELPDTELETDVPLPD